MSGRAPLVSIGMPVFNGERHLQTAAASLLAQTYGDLELIISDNASTDATAAICAKLQASDHRVRIVRQDRNIGAVGNFAEVLRLAQGRWFMWAAHDDLWAADWLERLVPLIATGEGRAAFGRLEVLTTDGAPFPHAASGAIFPFEQASALRRRLSFFLAAEGLGKANPIYALWWRSDLERMNARIPTCEFGDCLFLFDRLAHVRLLADRQTSMCKRLRAAEMPPIRPASPFRKVLSGVRFLAGQLRVCWRYGCRSRPSEALAMAALLPVKMLIGFAAFVRASRRHRVQEAHS